MLAKSSRLNKKSEIIQTVRHGKRFRSPYVLIYVYMPAPPPKEVRVACVVGKKVHKSAVKRHKYQRWLREVAKNALKNISPCHMVWVGLPAMNDLSSQEELAKSLEPVLKKMNNLFHND